MQAQPAPPAPSPSSQLTTPYSCVTEPGVYVTENGDMFRMPPEALSPSHSPLMKWETARGDMVTRVSADPEYPTAQCRRRAMDLELPVNF